MEGKVIVIDNVFIVVKIEDFKVIVLLSCLNMEIFEIVED